MKFNKEEWVNYGQWRQPTVSGCFWMDWSQKNEKFPFEFPKLDGSFIIIDGFSLFKKSDFTIFEGWVKNNNGNFKILKQLEKWVDDVHKRARFGIKRKFDKIVDKMRDFETLFNDNVNPWVFFIMLAKGVSDDMEIICKQRGYDFEKVSDSIQPLRDPLLVKQNKDACKLYIKMQNHGHENQDLRSIEQSNPILAEEIKNHIKEFEFLGTHHFLGEPYSEESFFTNFKIRNNEDTKKTLIPNELKWHAKALSLCAWARTYAAETSGLLQYYIKPDLVEIGEHLGIGDDYIWLSMNEIIKALEYKYKFMKPDIEARKKKVGIYIHKGSEIIAAGKEVDEIIFQLVDIQTEAEFPLKGKVACKGKVSGTARIVISPEDIDKLEEGDILVANETTPDFIYGMKKAGAIITNVGGVTSHAAIVSRELGKPCIIGVKDACYILKDGQQIEVDADNGIVRKLE